ncbi:uncharacterized protein LOC108628237 isoform X2 [Ceratina calcarata]|uniref:Uncharacterized protein LOC108628237 isoform X2 n=2 Tax=Ceratina calcarata TaxID=156304 RepID=A0AAJ7J6T1_9HYME|nr:uncharacterized protein LOC108628237 isoform X2 [Ceratina calcarata]
MMKNKKKRFDVLSANTSYRRPRSSLKVNLSCASNLTDSGNDSLDFDVNNITSYGIPLKNVSIVLERIDTNKENKLVETSVTSTIKPNLSSNNSLKNRLSTKIADAVDIIEHNNGKNDTNQDICNTPKTTCRNKKLKRTNGLGILRKIYDLEEHLNVCENVNLVSHVSKELAQLRSRISNDNDPMLMEIDEIPCSSKETNNDKLDCSIICRNRLSQSSILSISESAFTEVPIGCSTMIDDNVSDEEDNEHPAHTSIQEVLRNNCQSNHLIRVPQQVSDELVAQSVYGKETVAIETDSVNTVRTSLNVNTSVDVINSKNSSRCKQEDSKNGISKNKRRNRHSIVSSLMQESTDTVRTSLQMNTSYTSNQLQNNINIDTTKISTTESIKILDFCDANNTGKNNLDDQRTNSHKRTSQDEVTSEKIDSNCNENGTTTSSSIVNETTDKIETERNENIKDSITVPNAKKGKRKLLPLHECSKLVSFTPVQNECPFPRSLTFRKQFREKKNNKYNKSNSGNTGERSMIKKKKSHDKEKKTQRKPRKVISKKIIVKKIADKDILMKLSENTENCKPEIANVCAPNGSSNDFQSRRVSKKKRTQRLYIVTTGLSNECSSCSYRDKSLVKSVVRALGSAKIEPNVTKNTTHVVTTGVRTINLLHGIIRGCWLVGLEWVLKSLESKEWLIPEDYEMAHFSKAVSENRKDRQLFGKSYIPELFTACGPMYIEKTTKIPFDALIDLVKAAGGCITNNPETAKILVGSGGLKETWILDCITSGELQSYNQYRHS